MQQDEIMTRITLPHAPSRPGLLEWGRKTPEDMITIMRKHAHHLRAEADAITNALDEEFQVDVVLGPTSLRHRETLQQAHVEEDEEEID